MTMADKIKQAVADEFKYRAGQGRTQYSVEEVIYIVNEVIDEVTFEKTGAVSPEQIHDYDMRIRIIKGDLQYLADEVNKLSSQLEAQKIKGDKEDTGRPQGKWIIVDDTEKFIAKCSVCGRIEDSRRVREYPFCHCGARMGYVAKAVK